MNSKETMRKVRTLLTRLEKEIVDDCYSPDFQFKASRTRKQLEEVIEQALHKPQLDEAEITP